MSKKKEEILGFFDNAFGADVPINHGKAYLHLSYEEVRNLLHPKNRRKYYMLEKRYGGWVLKQVKKTEGALSRKDVEKLLLQARKPKDSLGRKHKSSQFYKVEKAKKITQTRKANHSRNGKIRFDWNDHYLEGMRIHGNKDDAEAHADDMKRKMIDE